MATSRREFLRLGSLLTAAASGTALARAQQSVPHEHEHAPQAPTAGTPPAGAPRAGAAAPSGNPRAATPSLPSDTTATFLPVETPDVPTLPPRIVDGVKIFELVAEPVRRELMPGRPIDVWGYNGNCPGPTMQVQQGDRVRIIFHNHLPEPTTVHWHGLEIPLAMDGMPYISQPPVAPGERFVYEFTVNQEGTYFYHSHGAMQEMLGMIGMFIAHPRTPYQPRVEHDFGIVLQGWALLPNNTVPNSNGMEFNWVTFNGKAGPAATPLLVRHGSRVRIRIVNLGMDHHPIHLHGHTFYETGTEAGRQPESTWRSGNTVLVGVAQARDIEFVASHLGDWMMHCHLPHHMMNKMADLMGERLITNSALTVEQARRQQQLMAAAGTGDHAAHTMAVPPLSPTAATTPGFPQDAFMEMSMDHAVAKAETRGLAANWSAGMAGMMTFVRVLPAEKYDELMAARTLPPAPAEHQHE